MPAYYNNAVGDRNINTLGNWWQDAAHTVAAVSLPTATDTVYIDGPVFSGGYVLGGTGEGFCNTAYAEFIVGLYTSPSLAFTVDIWGSSAQPVNAQFYNGCRMATDALTSQPQFGGNVIVHSFIFSTASPMPQLFAAGSISYTIFGATVPFTVPCGIIQVTLDPLSTSTTPAPLFFKNKDDMFVAVYFTGLIEPVVDGLQLQIRAKAGATEVLLQSDGVDTSVLPFYLLHLAATDDRIVDELLDNYSDQGSAATVAGQLLWNGTNDTGVGPNPSAQATAFFPVQIAVNIRE